MSETDDFDAALQEAVDVVLSRLVENDLLPLQDNAQDIVEELFVGRAPLVQRLAHPPAKRWWYWNREQLSPGTKWVFRGGDEYLNPTLCFRVPFGGLLIVATSFPLKNKLAPLDEFSGDE